MLWKAPAPTLYFPSQIYFITLSIFYSPLFVPYSTPPTTPRSTTMSPLTTAERIRAVEVIINYEFDDKSLLVKALEAAGATVASQGNKRLALIGDAALRLILYEFGYEGEASICEAFQ